MKKTHQLIPIIFFAAWITGCSVTPDVDSDKGACYLKAAHGEVFVKVFDLDRDGNMGAIVFQGIINPRQGTLIKTSRAQFRYYYNSDPQVDRPLSSGQDQACDDHDVVVVP
ncbi:MAG: hypothetical protein P8185_07855 [Deltaproteobacteria bacterium]